MKKRLQKLSGLLLAGALFLGIVPAGVVAASTPVASYCTHVQNIGWQGYVGNSTMSGTEGQSYRLEGIKIKLDDQGFDLGISYQTHIQNIGWEADTARGWKSNDTMSGTEGLSYRLEAIQIKLTGTDASKFNIYYQVHAQNIGWLDWAKNGESAGTEGLGWRLEGIRIIISPIGSAAPGTTAYPFVSATQFVSKIKGDWYQSSPNLSTKIPGLKIKNPYEESGLIWLGSKYYECRYRVISVAKDCRTGVFEAYEQNYYKPPNWEKIPINISKVYRLTEANTIIENESNFVYVRK